MISKTTLMISRTTLMLSKLTFLIGLLFLLNTTVGATERYQELRIPLPLSETARELLANPEFERMGEDDGALRILSRPGLTETLRAAGLDLEIIHDDLETFYETRLEREAPLRLDNFGIFHTFDETVVEINALHSEFPGITSAPISIGQSHEGRDLWAYKISDNPEIDEDEPELLFDALHHAREIMTVEMLIDFPRYLCENYGTDPVVTQLVDSREIWFVPIVNPDGFVYNEQTNPNGGGMWRKNRRDNGIPSCPGVDPNRNYDYEWVGSGSSTDPCSDVYRGPAPHSEPEIAALTDFINAHQFAIWQSYHSVYGAVLFPWGYTTATTPDDATFNAMAAEMAAPNGYAIGQAWEVIGYTVNGGAFDWGYDAITEHAKIYAFTTEIGGSGFWPDPSERDGLIAENLHSNLFLCQAAGAWLDLLSLDVDDTAAGNGNDRLDPGETAALVLTGRNPGLLVDATNVRVVLQCDDPYVILTDALFDAGTVAAGSSFDNLADPFQLDVSAACPEGRSVAFTVRFEADGGFAVESTLSLTVGQLPVIAQTDFETDPGGWTLDPSHSASTGEFVRIDPNPTDYQPGDDTTPAPGLFAWITGQNSSVGADDVDGGIAATRSPAYDLSGYGSVRLDLMYFHGQRDSGDDPSGDFFRIDLSNDGGASYPASLVQVGDQWSPADWQNLQVDLEDHLPLTAQMVLRVQASDGASTGDIIEAGIDDLLLLEGGAGNEAPDAPGLLAPVDGSTGLSSAPTLEVWNAFDPDADPLTYGFRVYSDPELTQTVASVDGIAEGTASTAWTVDPPLANGTYHWRAFADDGTVLGLYMDPAGFEISLTSDVTSGPAGGTGIGLAAFPNPSPGDVRIRYFTPRTPDAGLEIFDLEGRRVRTLDSVRWTEGWQEVVWDGRSDSGSPVAAGVYWVKLVLPHQTRTVRVIQIR